MVEQVKDFLNVSCSMRAKRMIYYTGKIATYLDSKRDYGRELEISRWAIEVKVQT